MPRMIYPLLALVFAGCVSIGRPARAEDTAANQPPPLKDPTIVLVRDDAVRGELALTDPQRQSLDELLHRHNRLLLAIRDVGPTGADATAQPGLTAIRAELKKILSEKQRLRMQNLILQAQGYDALGRKDVSAKLKLSPEQQAKLAAAGHDMHARAGELQMSDASQSPEDRAKALARLQAERHRRVLAELDEKQTQLWGRLLGEPFEFAQVRPSPAWAPEFDGIEAWLNSEPLSMESLRGQVVVVHFFAFGCINCIHNYPWYREWHEQLADRGVKIIGIHTPETDAETDNQQLRLSLEKNGLTFPVAIDKDKKAWQAWYNRMWPSVYLIDREGRVRYWWYGELDWEGAGNQNVAREQLELLLAEPTSEAPQSAAASPAVAGKGPDRGAQRARSLASGGRAP